jgi:hypothetical protein
LGEGGTVGDHDDARATTTTTGSKLADMPLDGLFEGCFVAGVATQRAHHHRQIRPALGDKLEHHLVEVLPMIPAVTLAHVDDSSGVFIEIIIEFAVVAPIHMEAGGTQGCHRHPAPEAEPLGGPLGNRAVEFGEPEGVPAYPTPCPKRRR